MQEIYYTKKFTAGRTGNEFLAFSQNPLYQIFEGKALELMDFSAFLV